MRKRLGVKFGAHLAIILMASSVVLAFSQNKDSGSKNDSIIVITQSKLDTSNISFKGKWKYHTGDDTTWAEKNYDDSDWGYLRNDFNMDSIKTGTWKGIGWFRKEFRIDSTMFNKQVALIVKQYGASEFYLNGKLVKRFGKISEDTTKEEYYNPQGIPFIAVLDTSTTQALAVRYANHKANTFYERYKSFGNEQGFTLSFINNNPAILDKVDSTSLSAILSTSICAIALAFALLHILIYFFYSREKENLYYALFAGSMALLFVASLYINNTHSISDFWYVINMSSFIWITIMFATYNFFLYAIFYDKMPKQFWVILIMGAVLSFLFLFIFQKDWMYNYVFGPFLLLLTAEGLRVIILAIKRKKRNSVVIGIGVLVFFCFVIFVPLISILSIKLTQLYAFILLYTGFLSLPLSMTIYLARESARTKTDLENRIVEVQQLSEKAIEQEKRESELRIEQEKERAEHERRTKELEEAREMQLSMLPKEIPLFPDLEIATYTKPATEVGGDYYDLMKSEDGNLTLIIGDATGHGLKAGTMVTATKSLFNSLGNREDVVEILDEFNKSFYNMKLHNLAMCMMILKIRNKKLEIASAGMPSALIYRNNHGKVEEILLKGMPLGAVKQFPYYKENYDLNSGDVILLMSDGFPERFTANKEMIDYEKSKEILAETGSGSLNEIIDQFVKYGDDWANGHPQEDDVTFVAVKIK
jgi:serine phosphatase RsbU (regulator of sigma subunit)